MLTIEPRPAASMGRPKARQHQKTPLRLTSMTFEPLLIGDVLRRVSDRAMPALQTRMSMRPFSAIIRAAQALTCADFVTSTSMRRSSYPFAFIAARPSAAAFRLRSAI